MNATKKTLMGLAIGTALSLIGWRVTKSRLPDSKHPASAPAEGSVALVSTEQGNAKEPTVSLLKQMMEGGKVPELSAEQLKAFVEKQNHSAASLLAAWWIGHDNAWLEEAAQRYPDDPRVALIKLGTMNEIQGDAKEWIERLKKNDPKNGLAWCYDAMSLLKEGAPEEARFALAEAVRLGRLDAYTGKSSAGIAAAYESTGYDGLSADMLGMTMTPLPHIELLMNLQKEWLKQLSQGADDALVQDMLHLSKNVSSQSDNGGIIMNVVATSMERKVLHELNVLELVPGTRKLVIDRLEELDQEKNLVRDLAEKVPPLLSSLNDTQLKQYLRRSTVEGELKAMQWLLMQHPEAQ